MMKPRSRKLGFTFVRVMKEQAKRGKAYIQPENGTTDGALMNLPSETLYMEAVPSRELADWLNQQHLFPVSPNPPLMTSQTMALVPKWYGGRKPFREEPLGTRESPEVVRSLPVAVRKTWARG